MKTEQDDRAYPGGAIKGMTKRELMATEIMANSMSTDGVSYALDSNKETIRKRARMAVYAADCLIAALNETNG